MLILLSFIFGGRAKIFTLLKLLNKQNNCIEREEKRLYQIEEDIRIQVLLTLF